MQCARIDHPNNPIDKRDANNCKGIPYTEDREQRHVVEMLNFSAKSRYDIELG
jgi:hypothetical protein